jgi:hypothetical protein
MPEAVSLSSISPEQLAAITEQVRKDVLASLSLQKEMANHPAADVIPPHPGGTAQHDALHGARTVKVRVSVGARAIPGAVNGECYPGQGCAHQFWPNGTTEAMVTERQFADLKAHGGGLSVVNVTEEEAQMRARVEAEVAARQAPKAQEAEAPAVSDDDSKKSKRK